MPNRVRAADCVVGAEQILRLRRYMAADTWVLVVQSRLGGVGFGISTQERVEDILWQTATRLPDTAPDIQYTTVPGIEVCWSPSKGHYFIRIPDWLSKLIIGMTSVFLLRGTHLQFSLRTLLIATTLVAVMLGLIVVLRQ
jgi:hypothetical protein